MRLIDADALERDGWRMSRTVQIDEKTMEAQTRKPTDFPTIEPERIRGRWVPITESDCSGYDPVLAGYEDPVVGYVCSVCGDGQEKEVMGEPLWNFCPNCGADMREEELDETD